MKSPLCPDAYTGDSTGGGYEGPNWRCDSFGCGERAAAVCESAADGGRCGGHRRGASVVFCCAFVCRGVPNGPVQRASGV